MTPPAERLRRLERDPHTEARTDRRDDTAADRRLDRLARILDSAVRIPGTELRVGLDPLIGLIPGLGDAVGALLSSYIVTEAARLGAPRVLLYRMAGNVALEALVGAVPVLGDAFDVVWKANERNVRLLQRWRAHPRQAQRTSRAGVVAVVGVLLASVALAVLGGALLVAALVAAIA